MPLSSVRNTAKLGGAIAELGTFQGASAKLIAETDSTRLIHLFDTFEGLPPLEPVVELAANQCLIVRLGSPVSQ